MRPGCRGGGRREWGAVLPVDGAIVVRIAGARARPAAGRACGRIGGAAEAAGAVRAEPLPYEGGSGGGVRR